MSYQEDTIYVTTTRDIDDGTEDTLWGRHTDRNVARIVEAIGGTATYAIPPGTTSYTLPTGNIDDSAARAHRCRIKLTGAMTAALDLVLPQKSGRWFVQNDTTNGSGGPWNVTVKMTTGTTYVSPHGDRAILISDGTNIEAFQASKTALLAAANAAPEADVNSAAPKLGYIPEYYFTTTAGTATVMTATISGLPATVLPTPCRLTGVMGTSAAGAATTLNVNGIGAYPILSGGAVPVISSWYAGEWMQFFFDGTQFNVLNPKTNLIPTGIVAPYVGTAAPDGWALMNDGTIGDAGSNATARAFADCYNLFAQMWAVAQVHHGVFTIYDSLGVASTFTTAAADWAAKKAITLPLVLGRQIIFAGAGYGLTARTFGQTFGAETNTHGHTVGTGGANFGGQFQALVLVNNATVNVMDPSIVLTPIIKL